MLFQLWRGQAVTVPDLGGLLLVTVFGGLVAASMAWVPAIGFMIYGARTGVRSVSYYAGAGVFCGLFCSFWLSYRAGSSVLVTNMLSYFFPGVVAGLTYWAIVGRHAGARPAGGAGDARALHDLVELAVTDPERGFGLWSGGVFFPMATTNGLT